MLGESDLLAADEVFIGFAQGACLGQCRHDKHASLAIIVFLRLGRTQCSRFAWKLKLWARREVLNVVLQVVRTWQGLAVDAHLASGG